MDFQAGLAGAFRQVPHDMRDAGRLLTGWRGRFDRMSGAPLLAGKAIGVPQQQTPRPICPGLS